MDENKLKSGLFIFFGGFIMVLLFVAISLMLYIEGIESYFINGVIGLIAVVITFFVIKSKLSDKIKATFLILPVVLGFDTIAVAIMSQTTNALIYGLMPAVLILASAYFILRYLKATWHYYFAVAASIGLFLVTLLLNQ